MAHKGKRQYAGAEVSNIGLGQGGWIWTDPQASDNFHAGPGTDGLTDFYYEDVDYWVGVKCFPTTDSADGNCLLEVKCEPIDTKIWDQSKADTPGDPITVKLQSGQSLFGAFSSVKIVSAEDASAVIYKG